MTTPTEATGWRPTDSLAHRLVLVRHQLGLSQREAAARTGITYGEWQGMESGREPRGLDRKIAAITETLGVDRDWLMWGGSLGEVRLRDRVPTRRADDRASRATTSGLSGRSPQRLTLCEGYGLAA